MDRKDAEDLSQHPLRAIWSGKILEYWLTQLAGSRQHKMAEFHKWLHQKNILPWLVTDTSLTSHFKYFLWVRSIYLRLFFTSKKALFSPLFLPPPNSFISSFFLSHGLISSLKYFTLAVPSSMWMSGNCYIISVD